MIPATTHCPICHHALIEKYDQNYQSFSYFCQFKPRHYFYLKSYYGKLDCQFVRFVIPNFNITYFIDNNTFDIRDKNEKHIMAVPEIEFDWRDLNKLSERIKKLITFI